MSEPLKRRFICIRCPRGCDVQTSVDGHGAVLEITGNFCKLGVEYVKNELSDPRRTVTSTVRVRNGKYPLAPVWTVKPVPKDRIGALMELIRKTELEAPVLQGQTVLENVFGLGVNVAASGNVERAGKA